MAQRGSSRNLKYLFIGPQPGLQMPFKELYGPIASYDPQSPIEAPGIHKIYEYWPILGSFFMKKQTRNYHMPEANLPNAP